MRALIALAPPAGLGGTGMAWTAQQTEDTDVSNHNSDMQVACCNDYLSVTSSVRVLVNVCLISL